MFRRAPHETLVTLAATLAYLILSLVLFDPLFTHLASGQIDPTQIFGGFLGGPRLDVFTWTLAWDWHALTTAASFADPGVHFPLERSIATTFSKLGHLPIFGPVYGVSDNPILASQVTILANFTLTGAAAFALARSWQLPIGASFFAGFVYAFAPARARNLFDPSLLAGQYLPLALLFLDRTVARARLTSAAAFALFLCWQMLCAAPYAAGCIPVVIGYLAFTAFQRPLPSPRGYLLAAAGAALSWSITWYVQAATTAAVSSGALAPPNFLATRGAISWTGFLGRPAATLPWEINLLIEPHYGWLAAAAVLAAFAIGSGVAGRRKAGAFALLIIGYTAALGDRLPLGPLGAVYDLWMRLAPGASSRSAPLFFSQYMLLGWSLLAAIGLAAVVEKLGGRRVVAAICSLTAIAATGLEFGYGRAPVPTRQRRVATAVPHAYAELAEKPRGTVVKIPAAFCNPNADTEENESLYYQTYHWQPIALARLDLDPPSAPMVRSLIHALPHPDAIAALQAVAGLRYIAVHLAELDIEGRRRWRHPPGLRLVAISDQVLLYETIEPPPPVAAPANDRTATGTPLAPLAPAQQRAALRIESDAVASLGFPMKATVVVTNHSAVRWPAAALATDQTVVLTGRWLGEDGSVVREEPRLARLPFDLRPRDAAEVEVCVQPPARTGTFELQIGLAQGETRFDEVLGRQTVRVGTELPPGDSS